MAMCRIILADDHTLFRQGLKSLIEKDPQLKVVADVADGEALLSKLGSVKCDLVVLDLSMPQMDGIKAIGEIHKRFPKIKLLVLTMQKDQEHLKSAFKRGAGGYLLKEDAYDQLLVAIKSVLKGKHFISPSMSEFIAEQWVRSVDESADPSLEILTRRECQVLKLLAAGLPNKNIASKLKISIRTVETHRAHLTRKLGIKSTAGLVKYAMTKGLL
jgi:DNA-binding NarL/FixJ family response regulator